MFAERTQFVREQTPADTGEFMGLTVNTNINASIARAAVARNGRDLEAAMEQLSTGRKINSAADNASGLGITSRMTSQIRGLDQAIRNANDAIGMVSTAEGALDEISDMLQRIRELAVQSGTGTTDSADRSSLNAEFKALMDEIDRIVDGTRFNGTNLFANVSAPTVAYAGGGIKGLTVAFQIGMNPRQTISVAFGNFSNGFVSGMMVSLADPRVTLSAATATLGITNASTVLSHTDIAIQRVSSQRAAQVLPPIGLCTPLTTYGSKNRSRAKPNLLLN